MKRLRHEFEFHPGLLAAQLCDICESVALERVLLKGALNPARSMTDTTSARLQLSVTLDSRVKRVGINLG